MPRLSFDSGRRLKRRINRKQLETCNSSGHSCNGNGSAVSTSALQRVTKAVLTGISDISTHFATDRPSAQAKDYTVEIPNEVFSIILSNLDSPTLLKCRRVCVRWKALVDEDLVIRQEFSTLKIDRFIVRYMPAKRVYELRWSIYESKKSKSLTLTQQDIKSRRNFEFNFRQFDIRRLLFKNMQQKSLTDDLISFLCQQFTTCSRFTPKHLTFERVDMTTLSGTGLQKLLASCGRYLHTFQILSVTGARPDSVTDSHISQLNPVKLQRICLENISFCKAYEKPLLHVGDKSLRWLADAGRFPTLALEKCQVTAPVVCLYTQRWLEKGIQTEGLRSHMCTLKQCPAVSNTVFEKECRRRSLDFENARGRRSSNASDTSEVTCYSIHSTENDREFTVALDDGTGLAPSGTIPALISLPV